MIEIFVETFSSTFQAVLRILLIAFAAGVLVRTKVITDLHIKALSAVIVRVLLPCLIFSNIVQYFEPSKLRIWPLIPLSAVAMVALGLLAGAVLFARELPEKKNMLSLASLQNAGYLVLPVGAVLFGDQFEQFKLYCFLYILGISPILWTVGKYLITSAPDAKVKLSELVTPPLAANALGLFVVFTHINRVVPSMVLAPIELIGSTTVPLAIFVLGATLGTISFCLRPYIFDAVRVILVKMIIIPLCTIAVLWLTGVSASYPLLASFFVIQASSAPATATIIQVRHYGGDEQKISSIMLLCYLFCIIAIPFWTALWVTISS